MAGDDDTAATGRLLLVDEVLSAEAGLLAGSAKGFGILVGANTAEVDNRVRGKDVL